MLNVKNLSIFKGNQTIIDNITLEIKKGVVLGIVGENGAGKSTFLRILSGCGNPNRGVVTYEEWSLIQNPGIWKEIVAYMPEEPSLYKELSGIQNIRFRAEINGLNWNSILTEVKFWCEKFQLHSFMDKPVSVLSKGEKKRISLVQIAILKKPIVVLDEPEDGLDPVQIGAFRSMIQGLKGSSTIVISSHTLSEISRLCDEYVHLKNGKLIDSGEPSLEKLQSLFESGGS